MSELIGKAVGQYKIVERIGAGGMATIFKAYQASIDRHVAIKVLPSQLASDPNFVKRFAHEARAIAALEHPHIVPMHDYGTEGELNYMVMRYVNGGTLSDIMGKPVPVDRVTDIVGNIARALDYSHQNGVVHRDIKPSNILIDEQGEVLLTDFGIAKMTENSASTQLTADGSILGTPAYMAPEQAQAHPVDGRTDIYSLGVVLYELLTGRPPYEAETPYSVVIKHISAPLPLPRTINADLPDAFEQVVIKAMAKDPEDRYQRAGQMEQALRNALKESQGTLIVPKPETVTESPAVQTAVPQAPSLPQAKKQSQMGPLLIGGIIAAVLLCVAGGGVAALLLLTAGDDNEAATEVTDVAATTAPLDAPAAIAPEDNAATETPSSSNEPTAVPTSVPTTAPTQTPAESGADIIAVSPDQLGGEILFEDRFDSNQNGWFSGEDEDEYGFSFAEIIDGQYRLSQDADQGVVWWSTPEDGASFADFILSVEATPVENNAPFGYGLIFRNNSDREFYVFEIDDQGFFVSLFTNDEWQTLIEYTETPAVKIDDTNQLMVTAAGSTFTFYINGQKVGSLEDSTVPSGSLGVMLELFEAGDSAAVDYDDFVIRQFGDGPARTDDGDGAEGDIIFAEYFDDDSNGWSTGDFEDDYTQNNITIADGKYTLAVTAKQLAYVEKMPPNLEFSDFILTLEATPADSEEHYSYGIAFRENSQGHSYAFEIGNDGLYSILLFDGEWSQLKDWSSTKAINIGQVNELEIVAAGSTMTFSVNGETLTTLEDSTLAEGSIGLIIDMFEEGRSATVSFDNLVIRELGSGQ